MKMKERASPTPKQLLAIKWHSLRGRNGKRPFQQLNENGDRTNGHQLGQHSDEGTSPLYRICSFLRYWSVLADVLTTRLFPVTPGDALYVECT